MALTIFLAAAGCKGASMPALDITLEPGEVTLGVDEYGVFYTYVPEALPPSLDILVLIHGTPPGPDQAEVYANLYAEAWVDFANKHGIILIAPVFNQEDFSSVLGNHALGGYRGLFGREIQADAWVLRLVDAHRRAYAVKDEPFYLYGHSAGGQFTARFLVIHPERVKAAVITAAATYPQPVRDAVWPFGMGDLHAEIVWEDGTRQRVEVKPDKEKWLAAVQIPLTVIVGLNDTTELPADLIPWQEGKNRFAIAGNWVKAMAAFAEDGQVPCRYELGVIPGKGHSMIALLPYSQKALLENEK